MPKQASRAGAKSNEQKKEEEILTEQMQDLTVPVILAKTNQKRRADYLLAKRRSCCTLQM